MSHRVWTNNSRKICLCPNSMVYIVCCGTLYYIKLVQFVIQKEVIKMNGNACLRSSEKMTNCWMYQQSFEHFLLKTPANDNVIDSNKRKIMTKWRVYLNEHFLGVVGEVCGKETLDWFMLHLEKGYIEYNTHFLSILFNFIFENVEGKTALRNLVTK